MHVGFLIKRAGSVVLLWAASGMAFAIQCHYVGRKQFLAITMPLQVSAISVGRNVPVGTEVYRQKFRLAGQTVRLTCQLTPMRYRPGVDYKIGAAGSGGPTFSGGKRAYKTGIPGIGVIFRHSQGELPRTESKSWESCMSPVTCTVNYHNNADFELILVKLGEVAPGALTGGSLPTVSIEGTFIDNLLGGVTRKPIYNISISGSIQIVARTCSTSDISVSMGNYHSHKFTGHNSATGWKDFSIRLNDCPAFHGTVATTPASWTSDGRSASSGTGGTVVRDKNSLQFRIDPIRPAIHPDIGVLSLDPAAAGHSPAASGIGVQIATQAATPVPIPLASKQKSNLILDNIERSYSIPLRARYLQTASKVTPGPANASATFTISYE